MWSCSVGSMVVLRTFRPFLSFQNNNDINVVQSTKCVDLLRIFYLGLLAHRASFPGLD